MLASDDNNPNFSGARNPDSLLQVKFYMRSMKNNFQSEKEGRDIYYEEEFITIWTPGNQLNIVDTPVREDHKRRFPIQYAAFKSSQSAPQVVGTPLEEWPAVSRSQAEELKAVKFFTVEQIAQASDQQAQALGMNGPMLRQKAAAFLKVAKDTALAQHQAAELARKDQQIADLKAAQDRMAKQLEQLMTAKMEDIGGYSENPTPAERTKRKYTKRANASPETA